MLHLIPRLSLPRTSSVVPRSSAVDAGVGSVTNTPALL
jgi:hypothetical protein